MLLSRSLFGVGSFAAEKVVVKTRMLSKNVKRQHPIELRMIKEAGGRLNFSLSNVPPWSKQSGTFLRIENKHEKGGTNNGKLKAGGCAKREDNNAC